MTQVIGSGTVLGTEESQEIVAVSLGKGAARVYNFIQKRWTTVIEGIGGTRFPIQTVAEVSPELALEFLATSAGNRHISKDRVRRYMKSIIDGNWQVNNDDICFDRDGHLMNGQHRLTAIVESKMTVRISFKFGLDRDSVLATIDEGKSRTTLDVIRVMGSSSSRPEIGAVGYLFEQKHRKNMMPREDQLKAVERFSDAAKFAVQVNKKGFGRNPLHAALLRAYEFYRTPEQRNRLQEFCNILNSGICINVETDSAAITLREFMIKSRNENTGHGRDALYRKAEAAIQYFMNGAKIIRLYGNDHELFPLPEEEV